LQPRKYQQQQHCTSTAQDSFTQKAFGSWSGICNISSFEMPAVRGVCQQLLAGSARSY
jgi:hypothetical protein